MSPLLDTVYSAVILLVAVGGIGFVFYATGRDESGRVGGGGGWSQWALGLVVTAFLAVMVGSLSRSTAARFARPRNLARRVASQTGATAFGTSVLAFRCRLVRRPCATPIVYS